MNALRVFLVLLVSTAACLGATVNNPLTTNAFMNAPSAGTIPVWNATAGKWSNATVAATTVWNATNTVFVSKSGNDTTAARGSYAPALTVAKAVSLAQAGDSVVVFPGQYDNCSNMLKQGVSYIGIGAPMLTWSNLSDTARGVGMFDDRWIGATTSAISGFRLRYGNLTGAVDVAAAPFISGFITNVRGAIVVTQAASRVTVNCWDAEAVIWGDNATNAAVVWHEGLATNCNYRFKWIRSIGANIDHGGEEEFFESNVVQTVKTSAFRTKGGGASFHCDLIEVPGCAFAAHMDASTTVADLNLSGDHWVGAIHVAGATNNLAGLFHGKVRVKEIQVRTNTTISGGLVLHGSGYWEWAMQKVSVIAGGPWTAPYVIDIPGNGTHIFNVQKATYSGNELVTGGWLNQRGSLGVARGSVMHWELDGGGGTTFGGIRSGGNGGSTATVVDFTGLTIHTTNGHAVTHASGKLKLSNYTISTHTNACVNTLTNGGVFHNVTLAPSQRAFWSFTADNNNYTNYIWGHVVQSKAATNRVTSQIGMLTTDPNVTAP